MSQIVTAFRVLVEIVLVARATMGADCHTENHPSYVELKYDNKSVCGGSLLTPHWILTAAQCKLEGPLTNYLVVSGCTGMGKTQQSHLDEFITHERFKAHSTNSTGFFAYDVAIAKLNDSFYKTDHVQFVKLEEVPLVYKRCQEGVLVIRANSTEVSDGPTNGLECVPLDILPRSQFDPARYPSCHDPFGFYVLGRPGGGPCGAPPGSPFFCGKHQVGIVSRGGGCARSGPPERSQLAVFTRVYMHVMWIQKETDVSLRAFRIDSGSHTTKGCSLFILLVLFLAIYYNK